MLLFETDAHKHKYRAALSYITGFLCGPLAGFRGLLGTFSWSGWAMLLFETNTTTGLAFHI